MTEEMKKEQKEIYEFIVNLPFLGATEDSLVERADEILSDFLSFPQEG